MHKKGISLNSVEKSLSHSANKNGRRTLLCFERILVSKIFMQRRGGGEGSFTVLSKFFLSHRTEKTSPGNHSVFQKISGREKYFMDKRGKRGGGYHDFPSKFLSYCTEIFHWRTLWCFRKILLSKIFMQRRGGITVLSHRTKTKSFVKEPFCFSEIFWYRKKIMDKRGHITIFSRNFYVSQCRKLS